MQVHGHDITDEQLAAGLAAMSDTFKMRDVLAALIAAGVPERGYVAGRAADRLLQIERKAGRVEFLHSGKWRVTHSA